MSVCGGNAKICVKCKKAIKSTDIALVCGLWCRNSFHSDCLGLSKSEARAATCSKERVKFHCEACENRLGVEHFGENTREPRRVGNCVNNRGNLLEVVQNLVNLSYELSNNNSLINTKLDRVLGSNARLEEYLLKSRKGSEKRSEETNDSVEYVHNDSDKQTTEIRELNGDTDSLSQSKNGSQMDCCASELQQTDSSSLCTVSDSPKHLAHSQQQNVAEGCSSDCLQEWEQPDGHNSVQDARSTVKEEYSPSEDFLMSKAFSIEKAEDEVDEEKPVKEELMREDDGEEYSPSEYFLVSRTLSIERAEAETDEEKPVREETMKEGDREKHSSPEDCHQPSTLNVNMMEIKEDEVAASEDDFEEVKHEVEVESKSSSCKPESSIHVGVEGDKNADDSGGLVTRASLVARRSNRIRHATKEKASHQNKVDTRHLEDSSSHVGGEDDKNAGDSGGLITTVSVAARRTNRIQYAAKEKVFGQNKIGTRHLGHRCNICKKMFTRLQQLKKHTHVDRCELRHSCSVCDKTFTRTSSLKEHFRLHTGERPYRCSVCKKAFVKNYHLREHSRYHTGERPYRCSVCYKKFIHSSHLRQHSRVHTGERPYSCVVCHKSFNRISLLKEHSRLHTGERPYSCNICQKKYKYRSNFVQHLLIHNRK